MSMSLAHDGSLLCCSTCPSAAGVSPGVCRLPAEGSAACLHSPFFGDAPRLRAHPSIAGDHGLLITTDDRVSVLSIFSAKYGTSRDVVATRVLLRDFAYKNAHTIYVLADSTAVYEVSLQWPPATQPHAAEPSAPSLAPPAALPSDLGPPVLQRCGLTGGGAGMAWDARRYLLWIASHKGEVAVWSPIPARHTAQAPPPRLVQRLHGNWPIAMEVHADTGHLVLLTVGRGLDFQVLSRAGAIAPLHAPVLERGRTGAFTGFAIVQGAGSAPWLTHPTLLDLSRPAGVAAKAEDTLPWVLLCGTFHSTAPHAPRAYPSPVFEASVPGPHHAALAAAAHELSLPSMSAFVPSVTLRCSHNGTASDVVVQQLLLMGRVPYFQGRLGSWGKVSAAAAGGAGGVGEQDAPPGQQGGVGASRKRKASSGGGQDGGSSRGDPVLPSADAGSIVVEVDAPPAAVRSMVDWAGTGVLSLTADTVVAVAKLADLWLVPDVLALCEESLIDNVSHADLADVLQHADHLAMDRLRFIAVAHLSQQWEGMAPEEREELVAEVAQSSPNVKVDLMSVRYSQAGQGP